MNILITGCNGQLGSELRLMEPSFGHHTFFNTDVGELDITDQAAVDDFVAASLPSTCRKASARNAPPSTR